MTEQTSKMRKQLVYICMLCLILFTGTCFVIKIRSGWDEFSFSMESFNFKIKTFSSLPMQSIGSMLHLFDVTLTLGCLITSGYLLYHSLY